MSDWAFDVQEREEVFAGTYAFSDGWALKVFLLRVPTIPVIDTDQVIPALEGLVQSATKRLSPEFVYGRFGFAIVHIGRRGTCISLTHFGRWGSTFEVFASSWYQYGYSLDALDLLDDMEPALCWFDFRLTFREIALVRELAVVHDLDGIRGSYVGASRADEE